MSLSLTILWNHNNQHRKRTVRKAAKGKRHSLLVFCRYLVGGYLSAEAVVNMFSKAVMETINWPSISSTMDCLVRPVLGGPELRLEIR